MLSCQRCHQLSIVRWEAGGGEIGDKNSILGKLCLVFHLQSAAVVSHQNLNHGLQCGRVGEKSVCVWCRRSRRVGWLPEVELEMGERNYTTSINLLYSLSVFQPPTHIHTHSLSSSSLYLPLHRISLFLSHLICTLYPFFFIVSYNI